jgi:hypothetical protein
VLFRKDDRLWTAPSCRRDCRARSHAQPQRPGRRLCGRAAVPDARLQAVRPGACGGRALHRLRPAQITERAYSSFRTKELRHDSAGTEASVLSNRDRLGDPIWARIIGTIR